MMMKFTSRSSSDRFPSGMPCAAAVSVWILIGLRMSTSESLLQDQYIGCFYDDDKATDHFATEKAVSIQNCISICLKYNTSLTYAALQNGNICQCRNDYGVQLGLPDSNCYLICTENRKQICGGFISQRFTYSLYAVCPIGTYGAACDKGCHCKRDIPCDRMTGTCPGGCYGNWSGPTCNITTVSDQYIECYKDAGHTRAMESRIEPDREDNTPQACSESCAENNFLYAGLQYSRQCFCGDRYDIHGKSTACNMPCSGDNRTMCGGLYANSVYYVCPIGNYGRSCAGRCRCLNNKRCVFRDGSCPSSLCQPGWKGTSCHMRDCNINNGNCFINETCTTINLTYSAVFVCRCPNGFQRTNILGNCTDTDECSLSVCDPDTTICSNTIGSYNCSCRSGFQHHNNTACEDIDECSMNVCDNDTTTCNNTFGSYNCSCRSGFQRNSATHCKEIIIEENSTEKSAGGSGAIGAVAGSISAVVAIVTIVAVLLLFCYCRRRKEFRQSEPNENSKPQTINPSQVGLTDKQREQFVIHCLPVPVGELQKVIQHKLTAPGVLDKEFKLVPMETKDPSTVGKNRDVKKKNRFRNIVPYDKNRVVLSQVGGVALSDYINASVIKGYGDTDKLVATQGPLPESIDDFWRMISEKDVNVIVMITDLWENNKPKCEKYWPDINKILTCNGITIKTTSERIWNGYTSRHFQVTKNSESWEVTQWHFLAYPDHGIPEDVAKFLTFLKKVCSSKKPEKYTIVHCSAGVGRTGTFIAIDYLIQQGNAEGNIDILGCLQNLRSQRPQMIQNLSQYEFVHTALLFEYTVGDTTILCDNFAATFAQLQKRDPNTGISKLDAQLQELEDRKTRMSKEGTGKSHVLLKSIDKHRIAEMNVTVIQGWKGKDAYITLGFPCSSAIDDFYSLTKEFNCAAVIFLDGDLGTVQSVFPTKEKPIVLRSSTVHCTSSSKEAFGTCYEISQQKVSDDTYANVAVYANSGEISTKTQMTVLHVTNLVNTDFLEYNVLNSISNCIKKLDVARTQRPTAIISRVTGDSLSAFCVAALNAFDMIRDVKEVDIFQIVQDFQKSRPQSSFSPSSYNELYHVVGKYIESN